MQDGIFFFVCLLVRVIVDRGHHVRLLLFTTPRAFVVTFV